MIFNLIQKRTSVRTFQEKPLTDSDIKWIKDILNATNNQNGPNGTQVHFSLLNPDTNGDGNIAGTYGFIRNAQAYIAGTVANTDSAIEDYGYLLEKIIIELVERSIGSCWLGGTFKREDFSNPLGLQEGHLIPAVMPVGYPVENRRTAERAMRFIIKADKRRKWTDLFYNKTFNDSLTSGDLKDEYAVFLSAFESVRLGPSASNKQPWRLVLDKDKNNVHLYLDEDPKYSENALGFSMQRLDAGIAMYHFEASAIENGFDGKWVFEDPSLSLPSANYKYIKTFSW